MKQIIQSYRSGAMSLEEVPRPQIAHGMVLVRTVASLISAGTEKMIVELARKSLIGKARARPDLVQKVVRSIRKEGLGPALEKVRSKIDTPAPLGYSCAGVVCEIGNGVEGFQPGDFVACGGAGHANHSEYNIVPQNLCVKIPLSSAGDGEEAVSFEEASFTTVGAIALQGVRQAALTLGERVCVIGLGLIGQLTVQICKASGCRVIGADIDPRKMEMAMALGADAALHSDDLARQAGRFTGGAGADAVIITAASKSSELVALAGEISRLKGRVIAVGLIGLDVPRDVYYKKELDLRLSMSYGPGRYDAEYEERGHDYPLPYVRWTEQRNMQAFLELVAGGQVDVKALISHRFTLDQALDAYEIITSGREPSLGVILNYSSRPDCRVRKAAKPVLYPAQGQVRLGVVGAGNFAKAVLLPKFSAHGQVKFQAVSTARGASAKAVSDKFGFEYCSESIDELLGDGAVNSVLIATRHNLHGPLTAWALGAGKNVFVEKPLCLTWEELEGISETYATCYENGKSPILMVGFNRRFSPFIQRMRSVVSGKGTPLVATYRVNAGFIPKDSWVQDPREGGGRIIGEVCHFVDTLRFLVGAPVRTVQAACIQTDDLRLSSRDSLAVTLTYLDGSVAVILYHALGNPEFPKEMLEIACDGQVLVMDDFVTLEVFGRKNEKIKTKQDKGFEAEIKSFVEAVANGGPPPIPFAEIFETTEVTFAIHEALNTGQVVDLKRVPPSPQCV
jgi:predicted dehydrogenase/threonine dehydrogenase-like Zn-dependent dehydrogenase